MITHVFLQNANIELSQVALGDYQSLRGQVKKTDDRIQKNRYQIIQINRMLI